MRRWTAGLSDRSAGSQSGVGANLVFARAPEGCVVPVRGSGEHKVRPYGETSLLWSAVA